MNANTLRDLNELLGRELGRRADGHSIFKWKNSDSLFWPAFKTGRKTLKRMAIPVLGSDATEFYDTPVDEYRSDRQMRALDTWVITKWLNPEQLIWGWVGKHQEPSPITHPSHETLVDMWNHRFPGADFPSNGWRIPTDCTLPRSPHDPREPNLPDTRYFIACVKEQTRLNFDERQKDMLEAEDRVEAEKRRVIEEEIREAFPAFLNPVPGKRSNFVSMPWSKRDRV